MGASNKAEKELQKTQEQQAAQSLALQRTMAEQPKEAPADNFMANKLKSIANLRLGLASTMGNPAVNSGLKTKLGA
jgi:hypothetical protein